VGYFILSHPVQLMAVLCVAAEDGGW